MSRAEMDELTVLVAQMMNIHDQRLWELETGDMRKVIIPAACKHGKSFIEVDTTCKTGSGKNCMVGAGASTSG